MPQKRYRNTNNHTSKQPCRVFSFLPLSLQKLGSANQWIPLLLSLTLEHWIPYMNISIYLSIYIYIYIYIFIYGIQCSSIYSCIYIYIYTTNCRQYCFTCGTSKPCQSAQTSELVSVRNIYIYIYIYIVIITGVQASGVIIHRLLQ